MTTKQALRTEDHCQIFGKNLRDGLVKKDTKLVRHPVTREGHTFYDATNHTFQIWEKDGSFLIFNGGGKLVPPETGVDALTDEKYTPIMLVAVRSRFQSLREPVLQQHNYSIDKMATHVKTAVNLKAQFVKDYLRPHWETLVREDQGLCNSCIHRMCMGMGKSNILLLLLIVCITEARAAIMQVQALETAEVAPAIARNDDMLAGNLDKLNNKSNVLIGLGVVMLGVVIAILATMQPN